MTKIKLGCVLCFFVFGIAILFTSNPALPTVRSFAEGPPPGHTGAPGDPAEQTCTVCHFDNGGPGVLTIVAPPNYIPGQTYQIQVQHATTDMTRMRWGFQMTSLDGSNTAAGTFTDTSGFTQTDFGNLRFYVEHTETGTFPGTTGGASWTFDWTAPATDVGPVTFYAAGNEANNDNTFDGDQIYTTTTTAQPAGSSTPTSTPTATPAISETPTETPTPSNTPSIAGTITYGNAIGSPTAPRFVKNVSMASTAGSPPVGPVITGTPGTYTLTGFGSGSYTITPSKPSGPNAAITSNDAARVAQAVAGTNPFVSQNQRFAADSSGNGTVSSNDAALIARFAAGLGNSGNVGQWKFFVTGAPSPLPTPPATYIDSRSYASVAGNLTGEDYVALLVGEASGNWNPAAHPRQAQRAGTDTCVELPNLTVSTDKEIIIPVKVSGAADKDIISYEFDLRFDPAVIQPIAEPADVTGTASRGLSVVANPNEPGLLRIVVYGAMPIDKDGVLLNLKFSAIGSPGSISPLKWEHIMFNEGYPATLASDGQIELSNVG